MELEEAILRVPAGAWAVAVSGGADSVALLHLLHARVQTRGDLQLHVVHLDHETRAGQSAADARFVEAVANGLGVPVTVRRRSEVEGRLAGLPANRQARYRAVRLALFREAVQQHGLCGVIQAHHADDQAETVFMRLVRGTGIEGMGGIAADSAVDGVRILRPLLEVRREALREYLLDRGILWQEDASNASPDYLRNQVRRMLASRPELVEGILETGQAFGALSQWLEKAAPEAGEALSIAELRELSAVLQWHQLRCWLLKRGVPADELSLKVLGRVRTMAEDLASGPAVCVPGGIEVRRRKGMLVARRMMQK